MRLTISPALRSPSAKWHYRMLLLAEHISTWSRDPSTKVGSVITAPDGKRILSTGFNGFPRGMSDEPELYENRDEKYSRIIHSEVNALLHADVKAIRSYSDADTIFPGEPSPSAILYTWPFASCDRCAVQMIQAGIRRFVFPELPKELEGRWGASVAKTKKYIDEAYGVWIEIPRADIEAARVAVGAR